jgi:hypothetical protein
MSRQIAKGKFEKNLRIGVRFDGCKFVLLDGSPLPRVSKNTLAELVITPESIEDEHVRLRFSTERMVKIVSEGASVMLGVSTSMTGETKSDWLIDPKVLPARSEYWFVEVRLNGDLWLRVRGDDEARLEECQCTIPALRQSAGSINHAFTLISSAFETKRRSHTGNVFERAFAQTEDGKWLSLDEHRQFAIGRIDDARN